MTSTDVTVKKDGEIVEAEGFNKGELAQLDSRVIPQIQQEMHLAKQLVFSVLEKDVDYGHTPGTKGLGLWDPGASKIIRAFHCHVEHKVIFHDESDDLITWTIEANIIYSGNKEIIGQGVGSASTRETKYKYRWIKRAEALALGYSEEDLAELKTRDSQYEKGVTEYRVTNPEFGDLQNTLLLMAAKRSETDAAKSLPGVGSALRILFDPELSKKKGVEAVKAETGKPDYARFWKIIKDMHVTEESAHRILGVEHMEDWLKAGHTLDDAISKIGATAVDLLNARKAKVQKPPAATSTTPESPQGEPAKAPTRPQDIKTVDDLVTYARSTWDMDEPQIWKVLNYWDRQNFVDAAVQTPYEAYQDLASYWQKFGK